jgi:predicted transposase/invertase (TIGR01784 family)
MLSKFLDPKNDFAFRRIFGTEKNKDILIHFLNDLVEFEGGSPIREVTFLKPIQEPEIRAKKVSIVDILCQDEKGNRYVVEMQVAKEKGFEKRAQYYASKAYSSQMNSQGQYHALKAVIFLAITDFIMFPQKEEYKSDHVILDKKTYENDLKDFSFTFLELPKFNKTIDKLSSTTEMWCYFFKHANETSEKDLSKLAEHEQIIARAYEELNRFSWNEEELRTYEQTEKYEWDYQASLEQKFDEGIAQGIEKGKVEGKAEGRAEGEKAASLRIAKSLLQTGLKSKNIQEMTGVSEQEIEQLSIYKE